jgi:hypothetical protein
MLYRSRQFLEMLRPVVSTDDLALAKLVFGKNSAAMALFLRMNAADQQHAIAVLQTLRRKGEDHPALLQAALLHDAGKAMGQPLLYRIAIVLLQTFWPAALVNLANAPLNTCPAWRRPFVIHAQHPKIGAAWAEEAGCNSMTIALIERHQEKPALLPDSLLDKLRQSLYEADETN